MHIDSYSRPPWSPAHSAVTGVCHPTVVLALAAALVLSSQALAPAQAPAQAPRGPRVLPPGPMMDGGRITLNSPALSVEILKYSGTVAQLTPKADPALDYTPGDRLKDRSADTFYHLGDLDLRIRAAGATDWRDISTAFHRAPVAVMASDTTHFTSDVTSSLPDGTPLKIVRGWAVEGGDLVLRFTISNTSSSRIELGGVGIPMVFNNIMNGRTLEQSYRTCSTTPT